MGELAFEAVATAARLLEGATHFGLVQGDALVGRGALDDFGCWDDWGEPGRIILSGDVEAEEAESGGIAIGGWYDLLVIDGIIIAAGRRSIDKAP